jgi:hypothetical protein
MENMDRCLAYYAPASAARVVDIGAMNVNGSYRQLFEPHIDYIGVDLEAGPGVDVVLDDPYQLPFEDGSVNMVISGQMLEHCAFFWKTFEEISRVLAPGGVCIMIAPSAGPAHYKVDYYRFYSDAWDAIAEWSGLRVVDRWIDPRGQWRDNICVFEKGDTVRRATEMKPRQAKFRIRAVVEDRPGALSAQAQGALNERLSAALSGAREGVYLQLGAGAGAISAPVPAAVVSQAACPRPDAPSVFFADGLSDDFFHFHAETVLKKGVSVAVLSGASEFDQIYRDFINTEDHMLSDGVMLVVSSQSPDSGGQTGLRPCEVSYFMEFLAKKRPKLSIETVNAADATIWTIRRFNKKHAVLVDRYNSIVMPALRRLDAAAVEGTPA